MSVADLPPPAVEGDGGMADDFTGTNSEKIDKLIGRVVEMRATLRVIYLSATLFVPSIIGLFAYLVIYGHSLGVRIERQAEKLDQLEKRFEQFEKRLSEVEKQQRDTNDLLRQLLARTPPPLK